MFVYFFLKKGNGYQLKVQIYGRIVRELCPEIPAHQRLWNALSAVATKHELTMVHRSLPAIEETDKKTHSKKHNTLYFHGRKETRNFFYLFFIFCIFYFRKIAKT